MRLEWERKGWMGGVSNLQARRGQSGRGEAASTCTINCKFPHDMIN